MSDEGFSAEDILLAIAVGAIQDGSVTADKVQEALEVGGFSDIWKTAEMSAGKEDDNEHHNDG
jgi:hypothetical protein